MAAYDNDNDNNEAQYQAWARILFYWFRGTRLVDEKHQTRFSNDYSVTRPDCGITM